MEASILAVVAQWVGIFIVAAALLQVSQLVYESMCNTRMSRQHHEASLQLLRRQVERETLHTQLERDKTVNGWTGMRKFSITRKVAEGGDICSFYLEPHDGKALPPFEPGQYLTFSLKLPDRDKPLVRCYSLSDSPLQHNHYRVSIKRLGPPPKAPDAPPGQSSNFFHHHLEQGDILDIKAPGGKFCLDQSQHTPVVLIGGGVGITPVMSMLGAICDAGSKRETWFFYGVRNGDEHIMRDYLAQADAANENVNVRVCYSDPRHGEGAVLKLGDGDPRSSETVKIGDSLTIGRDPGNDIPLDDDKASREHASVRQAEGQYTLSDLHSSNGTFVNGVRITEPAVLRDNDEIRVGNHTLTFHSIEDVEGRDYHFGERVSVDLFKRILPSNNYDFLICGPPPMMESIVKNLEEWGVPKSRIHFEAFGPASVKKTPVPAAAGSTDAVTGFDIVFAKSGKTLQWSPAAGSILDLAEANDIDMDFGCRAGSCGTCMTAVRSGEVDYLNEPEAALDEGSCLACIAAPKSPLTIDA